MTFKRPLILGVGSLGSILSEKIVNDNFFDKLSILDYDIVKEKNLNNSIFCFDDIGKKKIDVINDKFSHLKEIDSFDLKFIEDLNNLLFDCDIIIDCRDFLYNRKNIDIRLFVCNKSLIVDCRKKVNYQSSYEGSYFWDIDRNELEQLLDNFVNILKNNQMREMINKQDISEINLCKNGNVPICSTIEDNDIIIDSTNKISNPNFVSKVNKKMKAEVKIFSNNSDVKTKTIDLNLKNNLDIINELESLLPRFDNNNYIMLVNQNEISIIPETGAA